MAEAAWLRAAQPPALRANTTEEKQINLLQ